MKTNLSKRCREAVIALSTFARSAFGVGISLAESRQNPGGCSCSLLSGEGIDVGSCRSFRRSLFDAEEIVKTSCPTGLTIIASPLMADGEVVAVLVSDGFIDEEWDRAAGGGEKELERYRELLSQNGEISHLSDKDSSLFATYMERASTLIGLASEDRRAAEDAETFRALSVEEASAAIVGGTEGMEKIRRSLATFANSDEPVLIESEQGNGRHLIASLIHRMGPRRMEPFVCENLSILPEALLEKEIFGAKGDGQGGLIGQTEGGTLFLEGVDLLPAAVQRRLHGLIGGTGPRKAGTARHNVRLIAAADRNVSELVRKGRFRGDLHLRLKRLSLFVPPLRDRKEDIPLLVLFFLNRMAQGGQRTTIDQGALEMLQEYSWPGNVRELENELARATSFGQPVITLEDLSPPIRHATRPPQASLTNIREAVGKLETEMISRTLSETNWNKSQAARILGLSRLGLQKKIDRYGLDRRR